MVNVTINNTATQLEKSTALADCLAAIAPDDGMFAIAINQVFIPRSQYDTTILQEGDAVEIIIPAQGG